MTVRFPAAYAGAMKFAWLGFVACALLLPACSDDEPSPSSGSSNAGSSTSAGSGGSSASGSTGGAGAEGGAAGAGGSGGGGGAGGMECGAGGASALKDDIDAICTAAAELPECPAENCPLRQGWIDDATAAGCECELEELVACSAAHPPECVGDNFELSSSCSDYAWKACTSLGSGCGASGDGDSCSISCTGSRWGASCTVEANGASCTCTSGPKQGEMFTIPQGCDNGWEYTAKANCL